MFAITPRPHPNRVEHKKTPPLDEPSVRPDPTRKQGRLRGGQKRLRAFYGLFPDHQGSRSTPFATAQTMHERARLVN